LKLKVISVLHFPEFGGPHNQSLRLTAPFALAGIESLSVLPPGPGAERLRAGGVKVHTIGLGRIRAVANIRTQAETTARLPIDLFQLARVFRSFKPDVVQLNGLINPHGAIVARALGIPVVWQLLDTRPPLVVRKAAMLPVKALADVVMSTGLAVAEMHPGAMEFGERLVSFFPPVDTDLFSPVPNGTLRGELNIPPESPVIGVVANVNPQKGHEHLIDAFAMVRKSHPKAVLVIAGHWYDTHAGYFEQLKAQATEHGLIIGRDVHFLGSRSDIPSILPDFDVFALASVPNSEGAPTAIIEAMSSGVPVVATNVAAIPEVVVDGETGFLVPSLDAASLANRATQILDDKDLRHRMADAARRRVLAEFSLERCVAAHVHAYNLAIEHRKIAKRGSRRMIVATEVPKQLLDQPVSFRCPTCHAALRLDGTSYACSAGHVFSLVDGVPVLSPIADADVHKDHQAEYYDSIDEEFELTRPHGLPSFYGRFLGEKFRRSVDRIGNMQGMTALTVCGGSGMDAEFLARAGANAIASDISLGAAKRTLERSRRFGFPVLSIVADIENLPFEDQSVDLVYVHDGLHHLTDPEKGLAEMARVAKYAVSVTEPAIATVTKLGIKAGVAQEIEDAGNRVERLAPERVEAVLRKAGFSSFKSQRYLMYYRHEPGAVMRVLSTPVVSDVAYWGWRAGNLLVGRFGNKMSVQATRTP
jgi:glycosyltransferase involved in cell wall biosynthesis/ubiquinone/menaquinone biosynthesis C-methylase UbiE